MSKQDILKSRYKKYLEEITSRRLKILMPVAIILLLFLIITDIFVRKNISAVYSRFIPIGFAFFLFFYNTLKAENFNKTTLYNIFLALLTAMMYAKYFIHYNEISNSISVTGIIVSIFIISLEIKANRITSAIIFFLPLLVFYIVLFSFFKGSFSIFINSINIFLITIVGFFVNIIQNNFRYKTFLSNHLLNTEKKKLEEALFELNRYKDKLEEKVTEKTVDLKQALDRAKESDLLKTQFLLNISHELRTPMNAVLGFSEILSQKNPGLKKEADIIKNNLNILLGTIDNILLLSKLQTSKIGLEISTFKLSELNKNISDIFTKKIQTSHKNIELIFNHPNEKSINLNSDMQKILQIFNQLADNAVKYTEKGYIKIQYNIRNEDTLKYTISDTGIGIREEEIPKIFDAFRKNENKEKLFGGTGIGLSIAKKLSDLLNSEIKITSIPEKGTTVTIILKINI